MQDSNCFSSVKIITGDQPGVRVFRGHLLHTGTFLVPLENSSLPKEKELLLNKHIVSVKVVPN